MKILCMFLALILIVPSLHGQWSQVSIPVSVYFHDVAFASSRTGIAVGENGIILRTTNGGNSWGIIPSPTTELLTEATFLDSLRGWIASATHILSTTNGGVSWNFENDPPISSYFYALDFRRSATGINGWVAGGIQSISRSYIGHTTGNGIWTNQYVASSGRLTDVHFISDSLGWATGDLGLILHTTNGGQLWNIQRSAPDMNFGSVRFFDASTGLVVGDQGKILKTTNGGLSWRTIPYTRNDLLFKLWLHTDSVAYAVGTSNTIIRTTDQGETWARQIVNGPASTFEDVLFVSENEGWAVGSNGLIVRTTNGGGPPAPDLVAYYPFTGNTNDSSGNGNNGIPFGGASLTVDRFGIPNSAYSFNGNGYITVNNSSSLQISSVWSMAFWFKVTGYGPDEWMGMVTKAGPSVDYYAGPREMLSYQNMSSPITFGSMGPPPYVNEPSIPLEVNQWYHCTLTSAGDSVRSYLNGVRRFSFPRDYSWTFSNSHPLTIGSQNGPFHNRFFKGSIDEVRIYNRALSQVEISALSSSALDIHVSPLLIDFGAVIVGSTSDRTIEIRNAGTQDTLRVTGISSNNPVFSTTTSFLTLPPGTMQTFQVQYGPTSAQSDTATLSINSNDPYHPTVRIALGGRGVQLTSAPIISSIRDIPNDQGKQVRVIWYRSIYDGLNDSLHISSYDLWRRVDEPMVLSQFPPEGSTIERNGHTYLFSANELWDFIVTVPAVQFSQYSFVAPTLYDSTFHGVHWTSFKLSARTTTSNIFFSAPDSGYSVNNLLPHPPGNFSAHPVTGGVDLAWDAPPDPDIMHYVVHRSTEANFMPSQQTLIGNPSTTNYTDGQVNGLNAVYYKVATIDSAGNQSGYSEEIGLILTETGDDNSAPSEFFLHQNYPNPFNPETRIDYDVPSHARITLKIYNTLGQEIASLIDEEKAAGSYSIVWNAKGVASGTYWSRMTADGKTVTQKMLLIR